MDPWNALGNLLLGWIKLRKHEQWIKSLMSLFGTSFVSFWGMWGVTIASLYHSIGAIASVVLGFSMACISMATSFLWFWRHDPFLSKLSITIPSQVEGELAKQLTQGGGVVTNTPR